VTLRSPGSVSALDDPNAPPASGQRVGATGIASSDDASSQGKSAPPFSPDLLDAADGIEKLEALSERYPREPRVWRKLLAAYGADDKTLAHALNAVRRLVAIEPDSSSEPTIQSVVLRAAAGQQTFELAEDTMRDLMGSVGADMLYEVTTSPTFSQATRDRAWTALTSDPSGVTTRATPALRIAVELKKVEGCARKPLVATAERDGDGRSLPYLQPLLPMHKGCGVFGLGTCGDCFGDRTELNRAIGAIATREKQLAVPH
jgi:hypothetical protein